MDKSQTIILFILAILAGGGWALFIVANQEKQADQADIETVKAEFESQLSEAEESRATLEAAAAAARAEADLATRQAEEARKMLAAKTAKEEAEREAHIEELNARLAREAEERKAMELRSQEMAERIKRLEEQEIAARAAQARLEAEKTADNAEYQAALSALRQKEAEVEAIRREQAALEKARKEAIMRQAATEEAIYAAGGDVTSIQEDDRVSIYDKRKLELRQKASGHPERGP